MQESVIPWPSAASLAVQGTTARFPVRRVYCVGRNYAEHSREMGGTGRELPFFFSKPADAILNVAQDAQGVLPYPPATQDLHHEIELVVALAAGGRNLTEAQAAQAVWGYAIGLDMTRRDLQAQAKQAGRPWDTAKGFDHSAPIGPLHPVSDTGVLTAGTIQLSVNGQTRQTGDLSDMIWSVPEAVAYLSTLFELHPGDLLFTGTPAGVGAVVAGDQLVGEIQGLGALRVRID
ncbi:fumarylacetoacetate hydrolase family protein [Castellaniella sp.]|uniref:fumarylacetoacetate hydrolase family protein n=1 Tax=Castellaniella sp. TaxID=1955812 RepID=UPI002AFFDC13|nr:fumarylacetoacetate hydrolase family protein [Castellaniella sp.]